MKNNKIIYCIFVFLVLLLSALFVFPTLYKYDKLEQKYPVMINRITGEAKVLTAKGWVKADNPSKSEMDALRQELISKLDEDRSDLVETITKQVKAQIEEKVLADINSELKNVKQEITAYKKFETNPENYFTIGSTMDEVKKIMGTPDGTQDVYEGVVWWNYGSSKITFKNKKVSEYFNHGELRIK